MKTNFKHFKKNEYCNSEGDMEDMLSVIRKIAPNFEQVHYGFDYIEIKLKCPNIDVKEQLQAEIFKELLAKFADAIMELYTEETGWFKIYLDWNKKEKRMITSIADFKAIVEGILDPETEEQVFVSNFKIDDAVSFVPMYRQLQLHGIAAEERAG